MSLELIIQQIKVFGCLDENNNYLDEQIEQLEQSRFTSNSQEFDDGKLDARRFRISFGPDTFISKDKGVYYSPTQLVFNQSCTFIYDAHNNAHLITIQIFTEHKYADNSDLQKLLLSTVDLSQISAINGQYIESNLFNLETKQVGKLLLRVQFFKKGNKYIQKVSSNVFIQQVQQKKQNYLKVSMASKNIKNLMVNQELTNTLMTINSLIMVFQKEDTQLFGRQSFLMIKYGSNIKTFTKVIKSLNKENISWIQYHQFMKNQQSKFVFYLLYIDQYNNMICKAIGQIKYIIFDETINNHSIIMYDKRSNKFGVLMVKFLQKQVQKVNLSYKLDKRIKQQQLRIEEAISQYNKVKFEAKYNNHVLSQKMRQQQLKKLDVDESNKPNNPQQQRKQQMHKQFIEFLQKQVIKIQKQLLKRQHKNKNMQKKQKFLPMIKKQSEKQKQSPNRYKQINNSFQHSPRIVQNKNNKNLNRNINNSFNSSPKKNLNISNSTNQFRSQKVKLPKV